MWMIFYFGSSKILVAEFKSCMKKEFEMTDLGVLLYFLELLVKQVEDGIFFVPRKVCKRSSFQVWGILNCKAAAIPMNSNEKLQLEDGTGAVEPSIYRCLIVGLNYLTHTHPDIRFSVSVLSRFMHIPPNNILELQKGC